MLELNRFAEHSFTDGPHNLIPELIRLIKNQSLLDLRREPAAGGQLALDSGSRDNVSVIVIEAVEVR